MAGKYLQRVSRWGVMALALSVAVLFGASTVPAQEQRLEEQAPFPAGVGEWSYGDDPQEAIADPLEPLNRGIFWVNDKLYFYLLKPIARGLRVVPEPARISVSNLFANLATPVRLVNATLQLKFRAAGAELGRFVINSTVGFFGLLDPAAQNGLHRKDEDLGQTFGHYGVGSGFYLVLPLLGPSSARDAVGEFGDAFLDPLPYLLSPEELFVARALESENALSLDRDTYEGIKRESIDPYLTVRDAYVQRRQARVRN